MQASEPGNAASTMLALLRDHNGVALRPVPAPEAPGPGEVIVPFSPCGACSGCRVGGSCYDPRWLGLHRDGAFAELTVRVLAAHGVKQVLRYDPDHDPPPPPGSVDVAIESTGAHGLESLVAALRPGGTLVLKSRASESTKLFLAVDPAEAG